MARILRPQNFDQAIATEICLRLGQGESLRGICEDSKMPTKATVLQWLMGSESFQSQYARARQFWAESEFEEMNRIADTPQIGVKTETDAKGGVKTIEGDMIEHRRLQVDTRKWALARMSPKKYGDALKLGTDPEGLRIVFGSVLDEGKEKK